MHESVAAYGDEAAVKVLKLLATAHELARMTSELGDDELERDLLTLQPGLELLVKEAEGATGAGEGVDEDQERAVVVVGRHDSGTL